jgi:hypothetical protein
MSPLGMWKCEFCAYSVKGAGSFLECHRLPPQPRLYDVNAGSKINGANVRWPQVLPGDGCGAGRHVDEEE